MRMLSLMLIMSMSVVSADTYRYIVTEGYDPYAASTNGSIKAESVATSLFTGKVRAYGVGTTELSSRYRTSDESEGTALDASRWRRFVIKIR